MSVFDVVFVTTPARVMTPRFSAFFRDEALPGIRLTFCLKRREPLMGKDESGAPRMGWTERCSQEQFARAAEKLCAERERVCLNIEDGLSSQDEEILSALPECGALVSGTALTMEGALAAMERVKGRSVRMIGLETEGMILQGAKLLRQADLTGLVVGSSYLSESSQLYDQLGLDRYRSLLRGLGRAAQERGVQPFSTSNYCTFEPNGLGDKSRAFVSEQVEFLTKGGEWGSITRFYSHLKIAQKTRDAMGAGL